MLFCDNGYIVAGGGTVYCDGISWDRQLGECRVDNESTKQCDFETNKLCGWIQDAEGDFSWIRKNGWNSFEKLESGPKHDHTVKQTRFFTINKTIL